MRSETTGRTVPKTCKSWLCPDCNLWLRIGAIKLIASGAINRPTGWDAALFTFTEPARATLDLPGFYDRHKRTIKRLQRRGWIGDYCTAVEFQTRGALHAHVVAHVPLDLVPVLRPWTSEKRDRSQYRWHFNELVPMVRDLGWGKVCDAAAADGFNDLGRYAAKSLAGYATKEAHRKFKAAGAKRVRPIRYSHTWVPEKLRELQRGDKADPGPFVDITDYGPCR